MGTAPKKSGFSWVWIAAFPLGGVVYISTLSKNSAVWCTIILGVLAMTGWERREL